MQLGNTYQEKPFLVGAAWGAVGPDQLSQRRNRHIYPVSERFEISNCPECDAKIHLELPFKPTTTIQIVRASAAVPRSSTIDAPTADKPVADPRPLIYRLSTSWPLMRWLLMLSMVLSVLRLPMPPIFRPLQRLMGFQLPALRPTSQPPTLRCQIILCRQLILLSLLLPQPPCRPSSTPLFPEPTALLAVLALRRPLIHHKA